MITHVEATHPHPMVGGFSELRFTIDDEKHEVLGSFEAIVALRELLTEMMVDPATEEIAKIEAAARYVERFDRARDACDADPYQEARR